MSTTHSTLNPAQLRIGTLKWLKMRGLDIGEYIPRADKFGIAKELRISESKVGREIADVRKQMGLPKRFGSPSTHTKVSYGERVYPKLFYGNYREEEVQPLNCVLNAALMLEQGNFALNHTPTIKSITVCPDKLGLTITTRPIYLRHKHPSGKDTIARTPSLTFSVVSSDYYKAQLTPARSESPMTYLHPHILTGYGPCVDRDELLEISRHDIGSFAICIEQLLTMPKLDSAEIRALRKVAEAVPITEAEFWLAELQYVLDEHHQRQVRL